MRASFANHWNAALLDEYYERWQHDPASVDEKWSAFFEGFALGNTTLPVSRNGTNGAATRPTTESTTAAESVDADRQGKVDELVRAYRTLGHTLAKLDPLGNTVPEQPLLTLEALGFRERGPRQPSSPAALFMGGKSMRLGEMIDAAAAHLHGQDRRGVHVHPGAAGPRMGAQPHRSVARHRSARTRGAEAISSVDCSRRRLSSVSCTRATSARSASRSKAARRSCRSSKPCWSAARNWASARSSWAWPTADGSMSWPISSKSRC